MRITKVLLDALKQIRILNANKDHDIKWLCDMAIKQVESNYENDVDFDKNKFDKDSHGNLIPKDGYEAGETYGKDVIPDVEPDAEIQNEYGLEDELPAPWYCSVSCLDCKDQRRCNEDNFRSEIHRPHKTK